MKLTDDNGKEVRPLTGEEVKGIREAHEYREAFSLIGRLGRKIVIGVAGVITGCVLIWQSVQWFVSKIGDH